MKKKNSILAEDDVYAQTLDKFRFLIANNTPPETAISMICAESTDWTGCITRIGVAECLWRVDLLTKEYIATVRELIYGEDVIKYFHSLGANEELIREFQEECEQLLLRFSKAPKQEERWIQAIDNSYKKGDCFWYRCEKKIYGAVILEKQRSCYLIGITTSLPCAPKSSAQLMNIDLYTVAWFSEQTLLPPKRLHLFDTICVKKSFFNQFGFSENNGSVKITNYGQLQTWQHRFCVFRKVSIRGRFSD